VKKDVLYRRYLSLQSAMMMAGAATPFFAVYVQQNLGGNPGMVGIYLAILTVAGLFSNAILGRISRRVRYSKIMQLATLAGIGMSSLVLLLALMAEPLKISANAASLWLMPVFLLAGIRNAAAGVSGSSLLLNIAPEGERSIYIGFGNTWMGLVLLATGGSGFIVKLLGFEALFIFTIMAHLLALTAVNKINRMR
jgi:predicted MFS family arabinose efflux permease